MTSKDETARKYDALAGRYSSRYADPAAVAEAQLELVRDWVGLRPGGSVLEIGCADGFVTERLVASGYRVHAIDISTEMVEAVRRRLVESGLEAAVEAADVEAFELTETYDVVMAMMGNFFGYVDDPRSVLRRLADATTGSLLVDVNPRVTDLDFARLAIAEAGLRPTTNPFFVPQSYRLGRVSRRVLRLASATPGLRSLILRRKFSVVVRGVRDDAYTRTVDSATPT